MTTDETAGVKVTDDDFRYLRELYMRVHALRQEWPFGSVLERPADFHWDPSKVMMIATRDEHHVEVVHLNGSRAGQRERVNPLDWDLVPEDES